MQLASQSRPLSNAARPKRMPGAPRPADARWLGGALGANGLDFTTVMAILVTSLIATLLALLSRVIDVYVAYTAAAVAGLILAVFLARQPIVLICSLLVVTVLGESSLLPASGWTLPALTLSIPLLAAAVVAIRSGMPRLARPPLLLGVAALLYLGVAALSIIPSSLAGVRPWYPLLLVGTMALSLFLVLLVVPSLAQSAAARRSILVVIAAMGPVLAISDLMLYLTGPVSWAGGYLGAWLIDQLTILDRPTPIIFVNPTGFFERPASAATLLALSLISLLALRESVTVRRWRIAFYAAVAADFAALVLTLNRDGWLMMAAGAAIMAAVSLRHGRLDRLSLVVSVSLFALLGALTLNVVGADLRQDDVAARYGSAIASTLQGTNVDVGANVRGGATLSGREYLWQASVSAIKQKPLTGWGLGQDQTAIGPLLPPAGQHLRGFTSDSTWFVTGVERGLPGLATLVLFALAAVYFAGRQLWSRARAVDPLTLAMGAMLVALLVGGTFETYLLGALNFRGFYLGLSAGLATCVAVPWSAVVVSRRPSPARNGVPESETERDAA